MKTATINTKLWNTNKGSIYDPNLDNLEEKNIFKDKFERAKESLYETIVPQEIINEINREFNKL